MNRSEDNNTLCESVSGVGARYCNSPCFMTSTLLSQQNIYTCMFYTVSSVRAIDVRRSVILTSLSFGLLARQKNKSEYVNNFYSILLTNFSICDILFYEKSFKHDINTLVNVLWCSSPTCLAVFLPITFALHANQTQCHSWLNGNCAHIQTCKGIFVKNLLLLWPPRTKRS